jgi:hypothetical protein
MDKRIPPSFTQVGDALRPMFARLQRQAENAMLPYEIAHALNLYEMDLSDESRCLQILIVERAVCGSRRDIEEAFAQGREMAKAMRLFKHGGTDGNL